MIFTVVFMSNIYINIPKQFPDTPTFVETMYANV